MTPAHREIMRCLRILRKEVPTVWPVRLRVRSDIGRGMAGVTSLVQPKQGTPYFSIILSASILGAPAWAARLLVVHEYAHAYAWTAVHPKIDDHDPEHGVGYSRCYKAVQP